MEANSGGRDRIPLVIERASASVVVDGRRVALSPKLFSLLDELAAIAGSALDASELIAAVWRDEPGMTRDDLHALVWRLRGRLGDNGAEPRIVVTRKGLGYLIDTEAVDVQVVDRRREIVSPTRAAVQQGDPSPETPARRTDGAASELEPAGERGALDPGAVVSLKPASDLKSDPRELAARVPSDARPGGAILVLGRSLRWWTAAAIAVVALGAIGFAGGFLTRDDGPKTSGPLETAPKPPTSPPEVNRGKPSDGKSQQPPRSRRQRGRASDRNTPAVVAVAPPVSGGAPQPAPPPATSAPRQEKPPAKRQPVALPPPPTRYLYHLHNADNGDHFVTTDSGAVTQHEAKGYVGGAIGRVYVAPEKGTKAIALNYGSAFIFIGASPKTDPASVTVPLWYTANNAGDFFYTTSKAEASQEGWSASVVGYVRSL
ncbi:MAG: winged helix-turn-helix domain-containing protein [Actinomycetota bacterium]|nr:winged helix-turn-helix domain-containing protein [Actinomycetota bacterium]